MRRSFLAISTLSALAIPALGQPGPVINKAAVRPFFDKAKVGRVDAVGIGDSNQFNLSTGWDSGWNRALGVRYGMYATGLLSLGEAGGYGTGAGEGYSTISTQYTNAFLYAGAPGDVDVFLNNPPSLLGPLNYLYLPTEQGAAGTVGAGMSVSTECALSVNSNVRFHLTYGLFSGVGPGSFRPVLRRDSSPYTTLVEGPVISTRAGDAGGSRVVSTSLDLPQGRRSFPIAMRIAGPFDAITGPFIGYYVRAEDLRAANGASFSTIYGVGSQSGRDMAAALQNSSDETLTLYFAKIRELQDDPKRVLVRVCTALNDRSENLPSVGPNRVAAGNSPDAYEDNLQAIIDRVRSVWTLNGWNQEELFFLLTPSHPVESPDEPILIAFRDRAERVATANPRTACVRLDRLTDSAEMLANGWYAQNGTDHNHLAPLAYRELAERELLALIALECAADFNEDGGVDGADVEAFYQTWRTGDNLADVNQDGGVDGADVEAFYELWSNGGC